MAYKTTKKKIKNLSDDIDLSFYRPKNVLRKYKYTQNRLADEMGVSSATVNGIINGNPSIAQVMVLADAIGCSFFEFFDLPYTSNWKDVMLDRIDSVISRLDECKPDAVDAKDPVGGMDSDMGELCNSDSDVIADIDALKRQNEELRRKINALMKHLGVPTGNEEY